MHTPTRFDSVNPTTELRSAFAERMPEARVVVGTASDPGCVRDVNEDALVVVRATEGSDASGVLAVVCDGMGGHAAGEVASRIAIETVAREWRNVVNPHDALRRALLLANRAIAAVAATDAKLAGMGTTCIAVILREGMAWCAHVGDSRCYLVRDGECFLMTQDHSAVMELVRKGEISAEAAREHPDKNVINRALGARRDVDVTVWPRPFQVRPGDRFVLCSDGLYDVVTDDDIGGLTRNRTPQEACDALIARAREHGAPDNVSAIVLAMPIETAA